MDYIQWLLDLILKDKRLLKKENSPIWNKIYLSISMMSTLMTVTLAAQSPIIMIMNSKTQYRSILQQTMMSLSFFIITLVLPLFLDAISTSWRQLWLPLREDKDFIWLPTSVEKLFNKQAMVILHPSEVIIRPQTRCFYLTQPGSSTLLIGLICHCFTKLCVRRIRRLRDLEG